MKTELVYLTWVTVLTGLLWIPYIVDRISVWGLAEAVSYPANPKPQSAWAVRLMKAHSNAVENLIVFAALVLAAHAAGISNSATAAACVVYFWARVAHALAFTFAIPWIRTLAFTVGFFAQATLVWQLLAK
jgi:uncharacterized MAPEG superfamily protein